MADAKKALTAFLVKALNIPETEAVTLLQSDNDDETITKILNLDKDRVSALKKEASPEKFKEAVARAKKDVWKEIETEVKDRFEVSGDNATLQGIELLDHILTANKADGTGKPADVTEDQVRKSKAYLDLEKASKAALTNANKEWVSKWDSREAELKKSNTGTSVRQAAIKELATLNPILPQKASAADNQKSWFAKEVADSYEWEQQQDGTFTAMKDGKVLTNEHGHNVVFTDLVKKHAESFFEFAANNGGSNGGNSNSQQNNGAGGGGGTKPYPTGVVKPTTIEQLSAIIDNQTIKADDKAIVMQTWEAEHTSV